MADINNDYLHKADDLMYHHGLFDLLQKYGEVYIVGSYRMEMMTWNDIDFYMDRAGLNAQNYYSLASDILKEMAPIHFNGEIRPEAGLAFLGFETEKSGERWNVDIWWKGKAEIDDSIAYADDIVHQICKNPELKETVVKIKQDLIKRNLYGFDKGKKHYHSREIYDAVFKEGIVTTEQFMIVHNL
ncbi:MAG: hypothetical protein NC302_12650 [Bacteroidales bacterium]|nr:hypothetical protein [Bacteroidales bacterium]MCM1417119.1 hypothetical protein [bacterium]MCM1424769.1 hypothetical protein [bacterium]